MYNVFYEITLSKFDLNFILNEIRVFQFKIFRQLPNEMLD